MAEDEKKKESETPDDDLGILEPKMPGPLFWFSLLAIPLVAGIVISFLSESRQPDKSNQKSATEQSQPAQPQQTSPNNAPQYVPEGARLKRGMAVLPNKNKATRACNFKAWEGQFLDDRMKKTVSGQGRPLRVLPPGSSMSMDHNTARVNVELDKDGRIKRVWCG